MSLRLDDNGDFFDDGEDSLGGTTGITYGDRSTRRSVTEDANAGEADAFSFLRDTLPESAAAVLDLLTGGSGESPRADALAQSSERTRANQELAQDEGSKDNVIERLLGGLGKAYDKDPMSFLKLGLGTVGGMYLSDEKRKAAAAEQQAQINQQNNAAAIKQAEIKRINDARKKMYRAPAGQKPLTRIDGTPIFTNGVIKG